MGVYSIQLPFSRLKWECEAVTTFSDLLKKPDLTREAQPFTDH